MEDNFEVEADLEPNIPTAFLEMETKKMTFDMISDADIITDEDMKRNLKLHDNGGMRMDEICDECGLSIMFHPKPGWKCTNAEMIASIEPKGKAIIKAMLNDREVNIRRQEARREKRNYFDFNETLMEMTRSITQSNINIENRFGQLANVIQENSKVGKSQIVLRMVCPSWSAGVSIEVYSR